MHIYFSGIGGSGISSFAMLALEAGFTVSGSDRQDGTYFQYLKQHGITDISLDQSGAFIAKTHKNHPIDWFVYTSAISMEQPESPEIRFCEAHGIRVSKRDEFLNLLLEEKNQKLVAIAGTHGKSTTTAMVVWLCKDAGLPVSYSLGAKISFGDLSSFNPDSNYFVYECDEFDRNFLAFHPFMSSISGISWDHHEIYPTPENYNQAFRDFISQSQTTILWQRDAKYLGVTANSKIKIIDEHNPAIHELLIPGKFNREDAWMAMETAAKMTGKPVESFKESINRFPGLKQRMELLAPNLYTNYAHTPEKIAGGMSASLEIARKNNQDLVIVYEPLTNRRQHYIKDEYKDVFKGAKKLYWVPSYLAREDPSLPILTPAQLIPHLDNAEIAEPAKLDDALIACIREHLDNGDLVVAMDASGAGSLDELLRKNFAS